MSAELLRSQLLSRLPSVIHGFSTRKGGVSGAPFASLNIGGRVGDDRAKVAENRFRVLSALGRPDAVWIALKQMHGDQIVEVTRMAGRSIEGDGLFTRDPEAVLTITVADCVPVLLADVEGRAVAAVHAGWRGTKAKVGAKMVERLRDAGIPTAALRVAIGPAIGPCCFEIQEDVAAELRAAYPDAGPLVRREASGKLVADLWGLNRLALTAAGVPSDHIDDVKHCTSCTPEEFFSHRRDQGKTGRQAALIGLRRVSPPPKF